MTIFASGLFLILVVLSAEGFTWRGLYSGTNWCGKGDNGPGLGRLDKVDACCKTHDECDRNLNGFRGTRFRCPPFFLVNRTPITWSDCKCDERFMKCLKRVRGSQRRHARTIGNVYFNVLRNFNHHCIKYTKCCIQYKLIWKRGKLRRKCKKRANRLIPTKTKLYIA